MPCHNKPLSKTNLLNPLSDNSAGSSYLLHGGGGTRIPQRACEKDRDIQSSSSGSSEARTQRASDTARHCAVTALPAAGSSARCTL